jgi:hypothetical protein
MPDNTEAAQRTDRILLGACAAIWLAALGAGVAATVALVDLGTRHGASTGGSGTPWLLYAVIAISAAVIIGAVPLLLRARRAASQDSPPQAPVAPVRAAPGQPPPVRGVEAPTEKLRLPLRSAAGPGYGPREAVSPTPSPLVTAIDQLWLRCAVIIAIAMGVAMVAIGVSTYLMALYDNVAAWALYGLAGLVTVAMPAIPWIYLRQLRLLLEPAHP